MSKQKEIREDFHEILKSYGIFDDFVRCRVIAELFQRLHYHGAVWKKSGDYGSGIAFEASFELKGVNYYIFNDDQLEGSEAVEPLIKDKDD